MIFISRFFPSVFAMTIGSIFCVSCGSGSSESSFDSTDSTSSGDTSSSTYDSTTGLYSTACGTADNTYVDSFYFNSVSYGNMQSDLNMSESIAACSKGQFVFNGQCYDSMSFDDSNGAILFTKNGNSQLIAQSNTPLTPDLITYANIIYGNNVYTGCNLSASSGTFNTCQVGSYLIFQSQSSLGLSEFSWYAPSHSTNIYPYGDQNTDNIPSVFTFDVNFKMDYGSCYDKNWLTTKMTYNWYINGNITLNGSSIHLSNSNPLSYNTFSSIYPNSTKVTCNYSYTGSNHFTCYEVLTNWGNYVMYFDSNNNFSHIEVDYNPENIEKI